MAIYFVNDKDETVYFGTRGIEAVKQIYYVQADGYEAEKACRLMSRPMPTGKRVVYFVGD